MNIGSIKLPTIFEAIDRFSAPVRRMQMSMDKFSNKVEVGAARINRAVSRISPTLNSVQTEMLSYAKSAAITAGIIGSLYFSADQLNNYDKAVASFRPIVSDLSNADFQKYVDEIGNVANSTRASTVEVATAFEAIAGLNETFARTPDEIGKVTKAAIILSRASGDDLGVSAENLTGIMNQFNFAASEANRTINVLAAGQAVGAASITATSDAFKNAGSTFAVSNVSVEQSVALIQTLAKFSIQGAEAGTKLRGAITKLQAANFGYASGQFQINDALLEARNQFQSLNSEQERNNFILKTFGLENKTAGLILLENIELFQEYTNKVTGTNEALIGANQRTDTLSFSLTQLRNKWVNILTTNDKATGSLKLVQQAVQFVTNNLETIVGVLLVYGGTLFTVTAITKTAVMITRAWTAAKVAARVVTAGYNAIVWASGLATAAWSTSTASATMAQWGLNAAMAANPVGAFIGAILLLTAAIGTAIYYYEDFGALMTLALGPLGLMIALIENLRRNWDMVTSAFNNGGIIAGIQAIGAVILDVILLPMQQLLGIMANLPKALGGDLFNSLAQDLSVFRTQTLGLQTGSRLGAFTTDDAPPTENQQPVTSSGAQTGLMRQIIETITTNNSNITVDFKNMPKGTQISGDDDVTPLVTSTTQY